ETTLTWLTTPTAGSAAKQGRASNRKSTLVRQTRGNMATSKLAKASGGCVSAPRTSRRRQRDVLGTLTAPRSPSATLEQFVNRLAFIEQVLRPAVEVRHREARVDAE